jgi:hypothetical protein
MARVIAFFWGLGGILLLLSFAVYRLAPIAFDLANFPLSPLQLVVMVVFIVYMAYAEGYKGFHLAFAPRAVARALYLSQNPRVTHLVLAPVFCMGYIYATRRRQLLSIGLTLMVLGFVFIARQLPQPWRGIVDAGVVVGLGLGIASLAFHGFNVAVNPDSSSMPAEVPTKA